MRNFNHKWQLSNISTDSDPNTTSSGSEILETHLLKICCNMSI